MSFKSNLPKKIVLLLAGLIIIVAVLVSFFRSLTPWAVQYKGDVEQHLSQALGQTIQIKTMKTGWYWFQPVLQLEEVTLNPEKKSPLHIKKLLVGINLLKSLWHRRIEPGLLYLETISIVVRQKDGRWQVDGIRALSLHDENLINLEQSQKILGWLAGRNSIIIKHFSAWIYPQKGDAIPIKDVNISILNKEGAYKFKGEALIGEVHPNRLEIIGDVYYDPFQVKQTQGQLYVSGKHIALKQWQHLFPNRLKPFTAGKGNLDLWLDLKKGTLSSIQGQIQLQQIMWQLSGKKDQQVKGLSANFLWKPLVTGWQLEADKVHLVMAGTIWPENKIVLKKDATQNTYQLYAKMLLIQPFLAMNLDWPKSLQKLMQLKPKGLLVDSQLVLKDFEPVYILTNFKNLAWEFPQYKTKLSNLSGVFHWQPTEGRLELDSEGVTIDAKGYPRQLFSLLNGALDWKELAQGLRLSIDRLVVSQAELTLSMEGILDKLSSDSLGNIQLQADFSAKNLEQWIALIPKKYLKPKLELWLKQDVKAIGNASGKIRIEGQAQDFPFDKGEGVFTISSHLNDVALFITPKWQLVRDLEGYLKLDRRSLNVDLLRGDFQGAPLKQMNLRIEDIGKDKEVLLISGLLQGEAEKIQSFIMNSPLKQKLRAMKDIYIKGLLDLSLKLNFPLYGEDPKPIVEGKVLFKNNALKYKHEVASLELKDLSGSLTFNESGVVYSELTANLFNYPFTIKMESIEYPKPATKIWAEGIITLESLKKELHLPILEVFNGLFHIQALLNLTNDPKDFNSLSITSSLEGLAVNLPEPIGKNHKSKMPMQLELDFKAEEAIRLKAKYGNYLSTDLFFAEKQSSYLLKSGQLRLGSADALDQQKPGLAIVGNLESFDLEQWSALAEKYSLENKPGDWLKYLRIINVTLGKFTFLKQQFDKMVVIAKIDVNKNWNVDLKQENITGNLVYNPDNKALSGHLQHLHINPLKSEESVSKPEKQISPSQIPPLNLRIDNLEYGKINVGLVVLKSQSLKHRWHINYCSIESPDYQFLIDGDWVKKGKINRTNIALKLQLKNLAKTLEHWDIIPAVLAENGEMQFQGGWNKNIFGFSLASLKGTMYLKLKNGIITHLSPETEEKLGLGKLLSVLSLQTIPRRLKLDFSDLSHEGYSFDIFEGNFILEKGIMSTRDSYLDGPVAFASMTGSLDLIKRLYDLNLKISPHITASLPVVATIAGGPVAGVAAWIANKIINQSMQKIRAYSYKISGPWSEPVVQQMNIVRRR